MSICTSLTDVTRQRFKTVQRGTSKGKINTSANKSHFQICNLAFKEKKGDQKGQLSRLFLR